MTTQENGSLGLTKKAILKQLNEAINSVNLTTGLTDEQVIWIKNKLAIVEAWKDTAVAKFTQIDTKLASIETQGAILAGRITTLESKVTLLETKAANAVIKFNQIDTRLAAIEARLTAHGI